MKEAYEKRRREIALKPIDDDELPEQLPPPEPDVVDDDLPPGEPQAAEQPAGALPDEYDNVSDSDSDGAEGTCLRRQEGMEVRGKRKTPQHNARAVEANLS